MISKSSSAEWSDSEIQAAVNSYLKMLNREKRGLPFNKSFENRLLRENCLSRRTKGSIEFRMQNISAVLVELGEDRIIGYKPAKNIGINIAVKIKHALNTDDAKKLENHIPTANEKILELRTKALESASFKSMPSGILSPTKISSEIQTYIRDPEVRAWIRQYANGFCEGCDQKAPFDADGRPFLEIHHVKHLAAGGSDRASNTVALCPNCHRRCHYSSDKNLFTTMLYEKVDRLIAES
ncbi:HNH endonuclease [Pseudomonas alliivorans]|uniref:HNH endonuclease n=1 Tax=Pseudomonas alliivorans TaxID=2810613 RepID=UPI00211BB32A|nr:HNH endonuclease signature motif containing protein [Pseudomonas alliivorans]MCQ9471644.1 HNH endonuclease [Pseudomonas alliivorans]